MNCTNVHQQKLEHSERLFFTCLFSKFACFTSLELLRGCNLQFYSQYKFLQYAKIRCELKHLYIRAITFTQYSSSQTLMLNYNQSLFGAFFSQDFQRSDWWFKMLNPKYSSEAQLSEYARSDLLDYFLNASLLISQVEDPIKFKYLKSYWFQDLTFKACVACVALKSSAEAYLPNYCITNSPTLVSFCRWSKECLIFAPR